MKYLKKSFYNFLFWVSPKLAAPAQNYINFLSWIYFHIALKGLARLEEGEGRRDLDRVRVIKLGPGTRSRVFFNKKGEQVR